MRKIWIGAAIAVLLAASGPARADALQAKLDSFLFAHRLPGGVLLVSGPAGRAVYAGGLANVRTGERMTPSHRFYIASIGKMAVATSILQQVQDGRLALSDKVRRHLGTTAGFERLPNLDAATLIQLLDHSSGIPDYLTESFNDTQAKDPGRIFKPQEALHYAVGERPTGRPGQRYQYSNSNYVLLGMVLEATEHQDLGAILHRRVLDPAGMHDTTVGADPSDRTLAHGFVADSDDDDAPITADVSLAQWRSMTGDGPLVSTAADLEKLLFALFRDHTLLGLELSAKMSGRSAGTDEYGLGVERNSDDWGQSLGHTGSADGFESEAFYYVRQKTAIVFLSNGNAVGDDSLSDAVAEIVFGGHAPVSGAPASEAPAPDCRPGLALQVLSEGTWWAAHVTTGRTADGRCAVRYDGYGRDDDEAVTAERIRAVQ